MTKRQARTWGKRLFLLGLLVVALGSPLGWILIWINQPIILLHPIAFAAIGFALILLSFGFMAYGSRVGDEH